MYSDGVRKKPDLVCRKDREIIVTDVGVNWEGPNALSAAYGRKQTYYSTAAFINGIKAKYHNDINIRVAPYIVGARGILCAGNLTLAGLIRLSAAAIRTTVWDTLRDGWSIHADFNLEGPYGDAPGIHSGWPRDLKCSSTGAVRSCSYVLFVLPLTRSRHLSGLCPFAY